MIRQIRILKYTILLAILLNNSHDAFCQYHKGKVMSSETLEGIGYVSIGVIGRNVGTVSDENGNYSINITGARHDDSLRFSMIGYNPKCMLLSQYGKTSENDIYLEPKSYALDEVKVVYCKPKKIQLGSPVVTDDLRSGFDSNDLGSELGIQVSIKRKVRLKDINLNIAKCTYDSVTYRLNIYRADNKKVYRNLLDKPVYISFTGDQIVDVLTFDLSEYSIILEGNILIALELYKDLGEGKLLFNTQFFTGTTYHRLTSEGSWTQSPGVIGMYLNSNEIR